jgi:hypothetical protein
MLSGRVSEKNSTKEQKYYLQCCTVDVDNILYVFFLLLKKLALFVN